MPSKVDICNQALGLIKQNSFIASLSDSEDTNVAACLTFYDTTLEEAILSANWSFSRTIRELSMIGVKEGLEGNLDGSFEKSEYGWNYSYIYPDDCIRPVMILSDNTLNSGINEASDYSYSLDNYVSFIVSSKYMLDNTYRKVISTNKSSAKLVYQRLVNETYLYDSDFISVFIALLASKLALTLASDVNLSLIHMKTAQTGIVMAQEKYSREFRKDYKPTVYKPQSYALSSRVGVI
jgi:hypothetical protein